MKIIENISCRTGVGGALSSATQVLASMSFIISVHLKAPAREDPRRAFFFYERLFGISSEPGMEGAQIKEDIAI